MHKKMKKLFLRQSYLDSWQDYENSLKRKNFILWDYIVLTASNDEQAKTYEKQIERRLKGGYLPSKTKYMVIADPEGKRVGSGGATFNVLEHIAEREEFNNPFSGKRILVIHSGGDSKRVPQYSAVGKLFSPVPRLLPDGRRSTLFDEFIIAMSAVAGRIKEGCLILSGDVLLLFNPLQIDFQMGEAAAISIKEPVSIGKNHGVFLSDNHGGVKNFLHKMSEEELYKMGAVNEQKNVDLDTGAILLDSCILNDLYSLISTDNRSDKNKFDKFVNDKARVSFYGDFLYPMAKQSEYEKYLREKPEGDMCDELIECRKMLWKTLRKYSLRLISLSPAEFIHFGTTGELLNLMCNDIEDFEFLDWNRAIISIFDETREFSCSNSCVGEECKIKAPVYIEDSYIKNSSVSENCVISSVELNEVNVPEGITMHGMRLKNGKYVVRIYGTNDNPKDMPEAGKTFLNTDICDMVEKLGAENLWEDTDNQYMWFARLYPVCKTMGEAVKKSLELIDIINGQKSPFGWEQCERTSLFESFNECDTEYIDAWQKNLEATVRVNNFVNALKKKKTTEEALKELGKTVTSEQVDILMGIAAAAEYDIKIRIYYCLSKAQISDFSMSNEDFEQACFKTIGAMVLKSTREQYSRRKFAKIEKEEAEVRLPVRVNWGGGWSDTPPYCNENGGAVLNAAVMLNGELPVVVYAKKLEKCVIVLESADSGVVGEFTEISDIQNCADPFDQFALHKAALVACGVVPMLKGISLEEILNYYGGGLYISTAVLNIPRGSGLGTSSILAAACVKCLFEIMGEKIDENEIFGRVMCMEQLMSTGGGWQDQVGGMLPGIKFITTKAEVSQKIKVENVIIDDKTKEELNERFALIYTGQRRLARNLLREVVGKYISYDKETVYVLKKIQEIAALMRFELERGNIDNFAELLNEHWELSKRLDSGCTNTCIEQIFLACEDLIDAKFICGAGGGGFLQVILKKNISKETLDERLKGVFQESGVGVWKSEIMF